MLKYKYLDHTADVKFQAFGLTLEEVFENAALAVANLICQQNVDERQTIPLHVEGRDLESLLYNFLEEFLVLFDSSDFLLARVVDVELDDQQLKLDAKAVGDHLGNYELHLGIKAVTYSDMFVRSINNSWIAQVVLDV